MLTLSWQEVCLCIPKVYLVYTTDTFIYFTSSDKQTRLLKFQLEKDTEDYVFDYPPPDNYLQSSQNTELDTALFDTLDY